MKKKSNSAKKTNVKKAGTKRKVATTQKVSLKKAAPKKIATRSAGFRDTGVTDFFRPICITQGIRLDEQCMSESQAFEIAQAHRRNTGHRVDVESC